jgi:hypothetical protein
MTETLTGIITPLLVGVLLIVIGIVNMTGNISLLHSYHRARVTEENRKPFGKMVGLGNLLVGVGVIIFGGMMFLAEKLQNETLVFIGMAIMFVFMIVGLAISFKAMKKYNGGIF